MNEFAYHRAADARDAVRINGTVPGAHYLGGGTNLIDLMREGIETPSLLVDVTHISRAISSMPDGGVRIGAGATNTAIAADPLIRARFPLLTRAILAGASGQIRNMATAGGNLMQRTRCHYFYDEASRCNKRIPGAGCDAIGGLNRIHAILGASAECIATHPSDMCVALAALDAKIHVEGPAGARHLSILELHRLPGVSPQHDTELASDELITAIELRPFGYSNNTAYRKVRDRSSYAFALVSVAAALEVIAGQVRGIRLALGGVAHKPWRASKAEAYLLGRPADGLHFRQAAELELAEATTYRDNDFKPELAKRVIVAVLTELAEQHP